MMVLQRSQAQNPAQPENRRRRRAFVRARNLPYGGRHDPLASRAAVGQDQDELAKGCVSVSRYKNRES